MFQISFYKNNVNEIIGHGYDLLNTYLMTDISHILCPLIISTVL